MSTYSWSSRAVLALLIALSAGCAHLSHLKRAQDTFSQGAAVENKLRMGLGQDTAQSLLVSGETTLSTDVGLSPESYYSLAYAEVNKALSRKGRLEKDGLLPTAYTLKALCEWKLKVEDYRAALQTARRANEALENGAYVMPRDRALMQALEGFIANDRAFAGMQSLRQRVRTLDANGGGDLGFADLKTHYEANIRQSGKEGLIENALRIVGEARKQLPSRNDLQLYLLQAQLASQKTWSDELQAIENALKKLGLIGDPTARQWMEAEEAAYEKLRRDHLRQLSDLLAGGRGHSLYQYWSFRL